MKTFMTLAALASLAFGPALAQDESNLGGTRLCLTAKYTVSIDVDGAGRMNLKALSDGAYAEIKRQFRAGGVNFQESESCAKAPAAFYVAIGMTGENDDGWRGYNIAADVSDWSNPKYKTYVEIWTGGQFGTIGGEDDDITKELLADVGEVIGDFVKQWKAANKK